MGSVAIPMGVRIPEPDHYSQTDALTKQYSLKNLAQQGQLNDARIREEQMKAQALEEDRRDAAAIQNAYRQYPGDMQKVRGIVAGQVNPRNLQYFDKSVQEHAAGLAKMHTDEIAQHRDTAEQLARHLDAVAATKRGDTSPEAVAARAAEWAKQVTLAKSKGYDPDNQLTVQYPGDEQLPVLDSTLRGAAKHLSDEEARRKSEAEAAMAAPKLTEAQATAEMAQRKAAFSILSSAASRSAGDYVKAVGAIKDERLRAMAPQLPEDAQPTDPLPEEFIRSVRQVGQTPQEQETTGLTRQQREAQAQRDADTALYRDATSAERARHDRITEGIQAARTNKENKQTANDAARDRRLWQRDLDKVKEEEDNITTARANLESVIASGGKIDEKGKPVKVSTDDEKAAAAALVDRARSQYGSLTNKLKRVTADKNDLGQLLGQDIGVKTAAIHKSLDADLERVGKIGQKEDPTQKQPPPASTPPPPSNPVSGKGGSRVAPTPAPSRTAAPPPTSGPAPTQPPASGKEAAPSGAVHIRLPNGKIGQFPNQASLDAWMKANNLTLAK